ncbi:MAG: DsrE family protein [Anaerocolumna sp.]
MKMEKTNSLYILWTNDNVITSEKMVLMYALNSRLNNWWNEVTVIIWGATTKLVGENKMIQEKIKLAMHTGVKFSACKACADQLNVTEELLELGIEIKYWGEGLTEILKEDEKLITI